ncbi:hypothetical protein E4T38_09005 [Aureobasidium subglaciale]|nr:hypothetical protein E4T38_09005 [Aureobasidium subglaciale]KAI5214538.1 hypothetical protein E4T40_08965 [Aureobasidium subglaciale]KAI5217268.1 hypothetical protein E4T41_08924 [Aureobasidium subglaciale]KAI5255009.1 hypothetical protein E4T46_08958 [Aureobasidium subglaciale]
MISAVAASEGLIVFYMTDDTVQILSVAKAVGECCSQILASGDKFKDMKNSHVVVRVDSDGGETGTVEIQDLLFTVRGATAGAVLVEWNMHSSSPGAAAMWDIHFRVGGAVGSELQKGDCPTAS